MHPRWKSKTNIFFFRNLLSTSADIQIENETENKLNENQIQHFVILVLNICTQWQWTKTTTVELDLVPYITLQTHVEYYLFFYFQFEYEQSDHHTCIEYRANKPRVFVLGLVTLAHMFQRNICWITAQLQHIGKGKSLVLGSRCSGECVLVVFVFQLEIDMKVKMIGYT